MGASKVIPTELYAKSIDITKRKRLKSLKDTLYYIGMSNKTFSRYFPLDSVERKELDRIIKINKQCN